MKYPTVKSDKRPYQAIKSLYLTNERVVRRSGVANVAVVSKCIF